MDPVVNNPCLDLGEDLDLPTIQELFVFYDSLYFGNSLGTCTVEWSPYRMTRCAGICYPQAGGGCILRLSEPLLKLRPSWELKNTLLHEMIHAWLITRGIRDGKDGHGPRFQAKAQEINTSTFPDFQRPACGYNITVYHTMHDEVRFYQQHHWKCSGCGKLICRAMNRKPQPADCRHFHKFRGDECSDLHCGYHAHLRGCSTGEFVKVKEPEGFALKQKGKPEMRASKGQRPRKRSDATRTITDFFKGGVVATQETQQAADADGGASQRDIRRQVLAEAAMRRQGAVSGEPEEATVRLQGDRKRKEREEDQNVCSSSPAPKQPQPFMYTRPSSGVASQPKGGTGRASEVDQQLKILSGQCQSPIGSTVADGDAGVEEVQNVRKSSSYKANIELDSKAAESCSVSLVTCPVCNQRWEGVSNGDLNAHLDTCLGRGNSLDDDDGVIVLD